MGIPRPHPPTLLIVAIFSRYPEALDWATEQIGVGLGRICIQSPRWPFTETAYYERLMGQDLQKQLLCCEGDYDPSNLAETKRLTNRWEVEYSNRNALPEERPLNLDPGYVTPMKVVLASTKDRAHRIYLRDGIFAEEALFYRDRAWQGRPWTYPDYLRADYHTFFEQVRSRLQERLATLARSDSSSS